MPAYDFKCKECETIQEDVILSIAHTHADLPHCCDRAMEYHITSVPMVHWKDYDLPDGGFKSTATPGREVITSLREKREYMKRNNLLDANEVVEKPTQEHEQKARQEAQESIKAITPTAEQKEQLKKDGLHTLIE